MPVNKEIRSVVPFVTANPSTLEAIGYLVMTAGVTGVMAYGGWRLWRSTRTVEKALRAHGQEDGDMLSSFGGDVDKVENQQ